MKRKLKILVVDDQVIIRDSVVAKLQFLYNEAEVQEASGGEVGLYILDDFVPDLIFMDISMPEMDGVETTREILKKFPAYKIVAYSMNDNDEMLHRMLDAGVKGYLLKTDSIKDFEKAIETVLSGEVFISKKVFK